MSDEKETPSSLLRNLKSPAVLSPDMSSHSRHPFTFFHYTFREVVTPTKQGNITMKQMSFSMCNLDVSMPSLLDSKQNTSRNLSLNYVTSREGSSEESSESVKICKLRLFLIAFLPLLVIFSIFFCVITLDEENVNRPEGKLNLFQSYEGTIVQSEGKLNHLQVALNEQVVSQEKSIFNLFNLLEHYLSEGTGVDMPVIVMAGPSGVGKSLISSFIVGNFPPPGKAQLLHLPLPPPKLVLKSFSETSLNLIAIDDLNLTLINEVTGWIQNFFNEAMWENKPTVIVLALNVQICSDESLAKCDDTSRSLNTRGNVVHKKLQSSGFSSYLIHLDRPSRKNA